MAFVSTMFPVTDFYNGKQEIFRSAFKEFVKPLANIFQCEIDEYVKYDVDCYDEFLSFFSENNFVGRISLKSYDNRSCITIEIYTDCIIISEMKSHTAFHDLFMEKFMSKLIQLSKRVSDLKCIKFRGCHCESFKKWALSKGGAAEEVQVAESEIPYLKARGNYPIINVILEMNDHQSKDSFTMRDRHDIFHKIVSTKSEIMLDTLSKHANSYVEMFVTGASHDDHQHDYVGSVRYALYDGVRAIDLAFYADRIDIQRFHLIPDNNGKVLDEFIDILLDMAKYFVDIQAIRFMEVHDKSVIHWCIQNGYESKQNGDLVLTASKENNMKELCTHKCKTLICAVINVPDSLDELDENGNCRIYHLDAAASNEAIDASELPGKGWLKYAHGTEFNVDGFEYAARSLSVEMEHNALNELSFHTFDKKDGSKQNNIISVSYSKYHLTVKVNGPMDILVVRPQPEVRSFDLIGADDKSILHLIGGKKNDRQYNYFGDFVYDLRSGQYYGDDEYDVKVWEV